MHTADLLGETSGSVTPPPETPTETRSATYSWCTESGTPTKIRGFSTASACM
jgi:hypothetical protein